MPTRPSVPLRRAQASDLETLVRHRRAMWEAIGGYSKASLDAADPVCRAWTRRMIREKRFVAWIAEDGHGRAIGSGAVWLTEAQPRPTMLGRYRPYILSMYTDPGHRGEGIASTIVRTAVEWARSRGFPRISLHASTMGRPVYRRLGFERGWEMRQDLPSEPRKAARAGARRATRGAPATLRRKPLSPPADSAARHARGRVVG